MSELILKKEIQLPENWIWTNIKAICHAPQYGWTTSASNSGKIQFLRTTDITSGKINWETVPFCKKIPEEPEKYLLKNNDIVISRAGSIGFSYLLDDVSNTVFASYLIRFRSMINSKFFYYFLQSPFYWKSISEKKIGIAVQNVNATKLKQIIFPLPPLPEQKRIVSKIESIFAQIDAERKSLDNAKVLLKQCRQSVLKSAFEGKLVPQDPNDEPAEALLNRIHKDSSDKLFFEKNSLPQGWTSKHLTNIAKINPKKPENGTIDDDLEVSFIPMKCVKELTGNIDLSITRKYTEVKKGYTCFKNGDIIFAKITPCMENGKIAIVHDLKNEIGFGSTEFHVIRLKDNHLSPKFYFYYLIQDNFRDCAQRNMKGTAGQLRVPSDYLKNSMIPIPPLPEQKRIVSKIESIFGRIDAEHNFAIFVTVFSYKTKSTCLHPICSSDLQLTPLQSQELISGYLKFHPQEFLALAGFLNHLTTRLLARICLAKFYLSLLYHHTNMI